MLDAILTSPFFGLALSAAAWWAGDEETVTEAVSEISSCSKVWRSGCRT